MPKTSVNLKFVLCSVSMFLLPFLILSGHLASRNNTLLKKDVLYYLELRAKTMSRMVQDALVYNYELSKMIKGGDFLGAGLGRRKALLEKKFRERPDVYLQFFLLDRSGKELACIGGVPGKPKDYSKEEIFTASISRNLPLGLVEQQYDSPPVLVSAEAIKRPGAVTPSGVLLSRVSLSALNEIVRTGRRSSEEGDAGLLDSGGMLIADSRGASIGSPGISAPREILLLVKDALGAGQAEARAEIKSEKGRPVLVAVKAIEGTQWWAYEREPSSVIRGYKSVSGVKRVVVSGILLIILFSFVAERLAAAWFSPKP